MRTVGILIVTGVIIGFLTLTNHQEGVRSPLDTLTFSNTAEWDEYALRYANASTRYPEEMFYGISIPPPPKNSSMEVKEEIELLKSYRELRTPEHVKAFIEQDHPSKIYFGKHTIAEYTDIREFPATALLLGDSYHDALVIEMRQKKYYDRVRPSVLDPTLDTTVPVHGHPAYPSYRAVEMYFIAYVLSELAPQNRAEFIAHAEEIAKNCQIAGLQYPSDTEAGILLAQQLFDIFMENETFQELLVEAKDEWVLKGLAVPTTS